MMHLAALVVLGGLSSAMAEPHVVINEIRYDPPGPDSGAEYVELLNPGDTPVTLDPSWTLQRGNGAVAGSWTTFWTGDGRVLDPGARLVIGDDPRSDVPAVPALQNGPDACRIRVGGEVIDRVGWGAHTWSEYYEGSPCPDPVLGLLARRPDGRDTDHNANDLVTAERETPGEINFPRVALGVEPLFPSLDPSLPSPEEPFHLRVLVRALGLEPVSAGEAGVVVGEVAAWSPREPLPPGGVREVRIPLPGRPGGDGELEVTAWVAGEPAGTPLRVPYRVGTGPIVLSEIQAHPAADEPEWVELALVRPGGPGPSGWRLVDLGGGEAVLLGARVAMGPVVACPEPDRLLGLYPELDPDRLVGVSGWTTLNDTGETLWLVDPDGRLSDVVTFVAPGTGRSLERVHPDLPSRRPEAWVAAPFGPTPGRRNGAHAAPPTARGVTLSTRVVGRGGVRIGFDLGDGVGRLRIRLMDPAGRLRGVILDREGGAGVGGLHWDGHIEGQRVPPGLYVLVVEHEVDHLPSRVVRVSLAMDWEQRQ